MARVIPVIAVLAVASCDGVFGLDSSNVVHDEDGDGVDDSVDNCPADANADQLDGDHDGVGDVCDPHRTVPGDKLVFFDGFAGNGPDGLIASGWVLPGVGQWRHGNDTYDEVDTTTNTGGFLLMLNQTFQNATVEVHFTQLGSDNGGQFGAYAVITMSGSTAGTPAGLRCAQLVDSAGSDEIELIGSNAMTEPFTSNRSDELTVRVSAEGSCTVQDGGSSVTLAQSAETTAGPIALWTQNGGAEFASVVVYTSP